MINFLKHVFGKINPRGDNKYMSEEQIVHKIMSDMTPEERQSWLGLKRIDLLQGHHGTGKSIRNAFDMWDEKNPHTNGNDPNGCNHPDQVSFRIMEEVWRRVNDIVDK